MPPLRIGTPHLMWGGCCSSDVPGQPNIAPELQVPHPPFPTKYQYLRTGLILLRLALTARRTGETVMSVWMRWARATC